VNSKKKQVLAGVIVVLVAIAGYFVYQHLMYVSTDNAQIGARVVMLSSRVNGTIQKVFVEENQQVKAGDTLAQIDTSDLSNASEAAEAQVASLEARYKEAEINLKRSQDLFRERAISRERFDNAQAVFKELEAKLKAAQSQLEQAKLNVAYTKITAPTDGTVARKSIETGQFVSVGQPLFGFVSTNERWVVANLKETDMDRIALGRKVKITVDAISALSLEGEVESISPATGAVFSLLPPDNATGNFTKVVQRVPVRIRLLNLSPEDAHRLAAGLSAEVFIKAH
jgi:membrane fusion protein (multidrug efflux system)